MKKTKILIPVLLIAAIIVTASVTEALNVFVLTPQKISTGTGSITDSDFTLSTTMAISPNMKQMTLTVIATNGGSSAHSAAITVALLDSTGEVITIGGTQMTQTQPVTNVVAGEATTLTYTFNGAGIVTAYVSTSYVVDQTA